MTKKLKRAIIKEELVALTGDFTKAVLLNQFIYWSERVKDFDKFIEEEKKRMEVEGEKTNIKKQNGWIYKTSEELSEETMLGLSPQTIRRHLKELIDNNWLNERENPNYKWDRTKQYRVNISKIQKDLQKLGYSLEGYPLELGGTNLGCRGDSLGDTNFQNGKSKVSKWKIKVNKMENQSEQNGKAIPETTTEITTETTADDEQLRKNKDNTNPYSFYEQNFGMLTPHIADRIKGMEEDIGETMVLIAMQEAVECGAFNIRYVETVVNSWLKKNITTPQAYMIHKTKRTTKKQRSKDRDKESRYVPSADETAKYLRKMRGDGNVATSKSGS